MWTGSIYKTEISAVFDLGYCFRGHALSILSGHTTGHKYTLLCNMKMKGVKNQRGSIRGTRIYFLACRRLSEH
jgi:hypothetical protein